MTFTSQCCRPLCGSLKAPHAQVGYGGGGHAVGMHGMRLRACGSAGRGVAAPTVAAQASRMDGGHVAAHAAKAQLARVVKGASALQSERPDELADMGLL